MNSINTLQRFQNPQIRDWLTEFAHGVDLQLLATIIFGAPSLHIAKAPAMPDLLAEMHMRLARWVHKTV